MTTRPGMALVVTVLLLAVLAAAGAGIFALGARESEIAAAMVRGTAARAAAESAVRGTVDGWSTRHYRTLGTGESVPATPTGDPAAGYNEAAGSATAAMETYVAVTRLADRLFLIEGATRARVGHRTVARAAALVRTLDPDTLAGAFPAAIAAESGVVIDGGLVSGGELPSATDCGSGISAHAIVAPDVTIHAPAAVPHPTSVVAAAPPPIPAPDPFTPPLIADVVTVTVEGGTVTPRPYTGAGGCEASPSNWGGISSTGDCHGLLPVVWSGADLTVRGGEGRGFLVVDGDLHLDGFRFEGVILVRGDVLVTGSTTVSGALRASSVVITDGALTHDPCAVQTALSAGGLDRAFRPSDRWWIPVF